MESAKDVVGIKLVSEKAAEPAQVSNNNSASTGWTSNTWGWLPVLSLIIAVGVMLLALATEAGRLASNWADPLLWIGLLVLFVPMAVRMLSPKPARRERIALLVMLGSTLYLLRDLEQPLAFGYFDEFLHWRTAQDIAASGHLFNQNPLFPINPFYPGMEMVTSALSGLTGLSLFASGMIVIGVAGLVLVLGLYLFYEYLCGSAHVAGIATLLYMAKPTFFSETWFHYEDLAQPLMICLLFAILRRSNEPAGRRRGLTVAIWLGVAAVVITHHLTSYMFDVLLLLWTASFLYLKIKAHFRRSGREKVQASPGGAALLGIVLSVAWLAYTGARVVGYLYPTLHNTVNQFILILNGEREARQFFRTGAGVVEPLWEQVTVYASVGLIMLGLPFGLFQIWRHYRANAAALALAVGVLAYPASQLLRLSHAGVVISGRVQPYLFIMIAFVLAVGTTHVRLPRWPHWRYRMMLVAAMAVIFIGGWVQTAGYVGDRLPGPFLANAVNDKNNDQRSYQPESVTAAEWARSYLGPGQRMISEQYNNVLMLTYGSEWIVTSENSNSDVLSVFTSPRFDPDVEAALRLGKVHYIVVDSRLIGEDLDESAQLLEPAMLAKFDGVQNVSRVFDSGAIVIYDVEPITTGKYSIPTPPSPSCTPVVSAPGSYPSIAAAYTGTFYDITKNRTTNISLSGIQQKQGGFCGYFSGHIANGPLKGAITSDGHIQFIVPAKTGRAIYLFDGSLTPDGLVVGTYCSPASGTGQCSDYGLWSISPAKSG